MKVADAQVGFDLVYDGLLMPQAAVSPAFFYDELGSQHLRFSHPRLRLLNP
jgi:uncharacterized SAM-dependent methyltransferase